MIKQVNKMKKLWNGRDERWYTRKELRALYPNKRHPDILRDRLNEKGMKKLRRGENPKARLFGRLCLSLYGLLRKIPNGGKGKDVSMTLDRRIK